MTALADHAAAKALPPPTLVLWGKIAGQLNALPATAAFPKAVAEHPYNLSFIAKPAMPTLFGSMPLGL